MSGDGGLHGAPPVVQDNTLILTMTTAIHAKLHAEFPEADDATRQAACKVAAELYQQSMIRDTMVATTVKAFGNLT